MPNLPPARTAKLDQEYTRIKNGVDGLVRESRGLLEDLGPEEAAALLTTGILRQGFSDCQLASYLAVAIIRLQQREVP